ncbi:MAG: hypothetical protein ILP17_00585 [Lachnospiraceae bacterium]|nr:hypothetical protein [Lachnospiraceae bacterium]
MYRKQMILQKIVCFIMLASSVITFAYSLGIMSDLYESFYYSIRSTENPARNPIAGSLIYYDMQDFNKAFLKAGIALILISLILFVTNTHIRRRYYIGNVVAVMVNVIANIAVTIWASAQIGVYKDKFLNEVDFQAFREYADLMKSYYTESTFWFDVHIYVFGFGIVACLLLVANLIWKFMLMEQEQKLIKAGKEEA